MSHEDSNLDRPLTILMVDDHPVVRAGFRYVLDKQHNYRVLEAASAEEAYSTYRAEQPDVIVMDISMPGIGGLEGIRKLKAFNHDVKIIVLSVRDDPASVSHTLGLGALAYLSKNCAPEELVSAIVHVMKGETYLGADLETSTHQNESGLSSLTSREFEVFQYLAQGESINTIAATLNRSVKTMNNHRSSIMKKLHATNTTQLALIAQREGLLLQ